MKQKIILLVVLVVVVLGGAWFTLRKQTNRVSNNKLQVTTSFYPYYFFTSQVGGDKVNVVNITPPGGEPHDYEPTPQDIINIESSKLLILNGNVEPWGNKIKDLLKGKNTVILETGNGANSTDPHTWLSLKLAKVQVNSILKELVQIDPQNTDYYQANANKLLAALDSLDREYRTGLDNCSSKNIITSHAAFGYLAADYGLKQVPITGLSPDSEPSLQQLTDITQFAKANNVKYIFFESLVSPKLSQTIASEVGAQTLVLNPVEGLTPSDLAQGRTYLTMMQDNLTNLKIALNCK